MFSMSAKKQYKSALDSIQSRMSPKDIAEAQELAKQNDPSKPMVKTRDDIQVDLPTPKCETKYVTKWVPIQKEEDVSGYEDGRTQSSARRKAKRDALDMTPYDACEISIFNFRKKLRKVRQQIINEQYTCQDDTAYGMGWVCDYVATVYCTAEERIREKVEICN